ncbi:hypothetical protein BH09BAC1_BH09BAC1_10780 [soil metagenome]
MKLTFTAPVEIYEKGWKRHVVFIPDEAVKEMGIQANTRLLVSIAEHTFRLAAISNGEGQYFLHLGQPLRRDTGIRDSIRPVQIKIAMDPNPTDIGLPEEFEAALDQDEEAFVVFNTLTMGAQRSLCHYVNSAKRVETRIKRALELAEKLRTRTLHMFREE